MSVFVLSSCEKKDKGDEEPSLWSYLEFTELKCERVGCALRVEYTMRNKSGKDLNNVVFRGVSATDNTGKTYNNSNYNKMSINGGLLSAAVNSRTFSVKKGASFSGVFIIANFDEANSARSASLTLDTSISDVSYSGSDTRNGLSWTDTRVFDGIQTNDGTLTYKNVSCKYQGGYCYWTFTVTSSVSMSNFDIKLNSTFPGVELKDNTGNGYNFYDVSYDGGNYLTWYDSSTSTSLTAGKAKKVTIRVNNFKSQATEISGALYITSSSNSLTCDHLHFYNIPVTK